MTIELKRENGFLDLDKYFEELKRNNRLTYKRSIKIASKNKDDHYWLKINGEQYYFKSIKDYYLELIAYEWSKFLGLEAVPYDLAIFNNRCGVISKDFRKKGLNYTTGYQILKEYLDTPGSLKQIEEMGVDVNKFFAARNTVNFINNLEIFWDAWDFYFKNYSPEEKTVSFQSLVNIFMFYIITGQTDGIPQNIQVEYGRYRIKPFMIDQEYILRKFYKKKHPASSLSTNFKDSGKSNYDILREFFRVSSTEFIDLFLENYNACTIDVFKGFLLRVENKIGTQIPEHKKELYIQSFLENKKNIDAVINEYNFSRRRVK